MTMHDIHRVEVTAGFAHCCNAAGLHLQYQTQGPVQTPLVGLSNDRTTH